MQKVMVDTFVTESMRQPAVHQKCHPRLKLIYGIVEKIFRSAGKNKKDLLMRMTAIHPGITFYNIFPGGKTADYPGTPPGKHFIQKIHDFFLNRNIDAYLTTMIYWQTISFML